MPMFHFLAQGVQFIAALRLLLSFVSVIPVVMDAPASLHNRSVFDSTAETIWPVIFIVGASGKR